MSAQSAAQNKRAFNARNINTETFQVGYVELTLGTADKAILLVDLSAATAAEWPHIAGTKVILHKFDIEVDIGSYEGQLLLGYVKEVDGTNGTIYIIKEWDYVQGDFVDRFCFGDRPWICSPNNQKYPVSSDYTALQDDAAYGAGVNATLPNAAVGDLVLIYDYANAEITRLSCTLQYSIL